MRFSFLTACGLIVATLALPAQGALRAWLDQNNIASGDTVQLNLAHDGRDSSSPDLGPLQQDFDILGRSRSSSVQIINGKVSSQVQMQLTLSPKHPGRIIIPPIHWGNDQSNLITLTVGGSGGSSGRNGQNSSPAARTLPGVFLEEEQDTHQPYVQGAVHLKVRLYTSKKLFNASLDIPDSKDIVVQKIGKDLQSDTDRNGLQYHVIERDYLLFPQRSGKLSLPGAVLDGKVLQQAHPSSNFDDIFDQAFFNNAANLRPIRLHGKNIELDVRPRPSNANKSYWLPARNVSLQANWTPKDLQGHTGDPINLKLTLQAQDLTAAQLPDLSGILQLPSGLKAYPDTAKLDNTTQSNGILGTRSQNIALIADKPGQYSLPAIQLQWWDTSANTLREVSIPARTITVTGPSASVSTLPSTSGAPLPLGNTPAVQSSTASQPPATPVPPRVITVQNRLWQWISLGLGILWLLTLVLWWWSSRRHGTKPTSQLPITTIKHSASSEPSRKGFQSACEANNAKEARHQLLLWAQKHWKNDAPNGILAVARKLDPHTADLVRELDRACNLDQPWEGHELLKALPKLPDIASKTKKGEALDPLYL